MPELPEVETIKTDLEKRILQQQITEIVIYDDRVVRGLAGEAFSARIKGNTISSIIRRGKAIVFSLNPSGEYLVVQLMMTGQLIYSAQNIADKSTKLTFLLSNGCHLHYNDQRLFGRLQIVKNLNEIKYFRILGPEPFDKDFTPEWLKGRLKRHTMPIKTLLMNHTFVAGIGNIYASEILYHSRIRPQRAARSLKTAEISRLHQSTVKILKEAILWRGTSMNTYRDSSGEKGNFINRIKVYGRENERCFRCRKALAKIILSGRSTFYCRHCQK